MEKQLRPTINSERVLYRNFEISENSTSRLTAPKSDKRYQKIKKKINKNIQVVSTIESVTSMLSPMEPAFAARKMVPQSPNLVVYPYARYGHLFE